jgi:hypothetical protein
MKDIFKGAANRASCGVGPLRNFYVALLDKGMKPEMARLTLARKIAAMALTLWKKEERFDAEQLSSRESIHSLIRHRVLAACSTESRSQSYAPSDNPIKP